MTQSRARWRHASSLLCVGLVGVVLIACGKKGPPLAPIVRLPAAAERVTAQRVGRDIYVTLTVPAANVDRSTPVDIGYVDVYAFTGIAAPPRLMFVDQATRIARVPVVPVPVDGEVVPEPSPDGVRPGASVTITDTLTVPVAADASRFYMAVPFSTRNRPGPQHPPIAVKLGPVPAPPAGIAVTYTATAINVAWTPAPAPPAPAPATIPVAPAPTAVTATPAEPVGAPRVNVYRDVLRADGTAAPAWQAARPSALNSAPLQAPPFSEPVTFGIETCYVLRSVTGLGEMAVEGDASMRACVTPVDRFAPAAPAQLVAIATAGAINLLWEANTDPDLAGYIVLRGAVGDATLQPLTPMPITDVRFSDTTVTSGMRYVYAVVAVDRQMPVANTSVESARIEETAQ